VRVGVRSLHQTTTPTFPRCPIVTGTVHYNGQIPTDPTTVLLAVLATLTITRILPAEQIGATAALYPLVHHLLAFERR
jgi:ABC-type methionine transport system permease subunit